jgi:hypothetical protein
MNLQVRADSHLSFAVNRLVGCFLSLLPVACGDWAEPSMIDPTRWAVLAQAVVSDRMRQGLRQKDVVARVVATGATVDERTIINLESGDPPKARKPIKLELVVAALGWKAGWADRILAGEAPESVLYPGEAHDAAPAGSPRVRLLELLPTVNEFSQLAAAFGAPTELRDVFDRLARRLLDYAPAAQPTRSDHRLAAARAHAEGEGIPADDVERIRRALGES